MVAFGVAGWFTWLAGAWPALIFAALYLGGLGAALVVSLRHNDYREVLVFDQDRIDIKTGFIGRETIIRATFPLSATRAMVEKGPYRNSPLRLILSCGSQRLEVGNCLTDEERATLCHRIRQLLQPGWERYSSSQVPQEEPPVSWHRKN